MEFLKDNWELLIAGLTFLFSSTLVISVKKFIKEIKDVITCVKNSTDPKSEDGEKISDKEKDAILKDVIEALEEGTNLWKLISGFLNKNKKGVK